MSYVNKDDVWTAFKEMFTTYDKLTEDQVWEVLNGFEGEEAIPIEYLKEIKKELKQLDTKDGFMYAAGIDTAIQLWREDQDETN